jgi:WD40 repeat protein
MNPNDTFDRSLSDWLRQDSEHRVPDHLQAVLAHTIATRQRPWWSSLRRWLPFEVTLPPAPMSRSGSWRPLLALAAVALLVAALLLIAVGSQRHLPPPFGPARNGVLVIGHDGDLFSFDPTSGKALPFVVDANTNDFGPGFSRDGTKFLFLRGADKGLELVVANADGSDLRVITPAVDGLDWVDWSPDSTRIAFLSHGPGTAGHQVNVVNVDGTGLTTLHTQPANQISWLPPNGAEILFRGEHRLDKDPPVGIYAVHPDGSGLRRISTRPALDVNDYNDLAVSPDGSFVAYRYVAGPNAPFRVHVLALATGAESELPSAPGSTGEGGPAFSPDGRSILYLRWAADNSTRLVIVPADGSGFGVAIGPSGPFGADGPTINNYAFTPDGTEVFANYDDEKVGRLLPIDGSPGVVIARGELAFGTYQRLAP